MTDVVITEFMDEAAVAQLAARFRIHYDPDLLCFDNRHVITFDTYRCGWSCIVPKCIGHRYPNTSIS